MQNKPWIYFLISFSIMSGGRLLRAKSMIFSRSRDAESQTSGVSGQANLSRTPRRVLFPPAPENSDTIITISDSDYSSDSDTETDITVMSHEEQMLFSPSSDQYTDESWQREIENFTIWIKQTCRKLDMMNEVAVLSGKHFDSDTSSPGFRALDALYRRIKRANEDLLLRFETLFDLIIILRDFCDASFVYDALIVDRIKKILHELLKNPGFQEYSYPNGAAFLKNFLSEKYGSESTSVISIFRAWKATCYYSENLLKMIQTERKYLSAFYFSILSTYIDDRLNSQSQNLTSVLELGMNNIETLENFLCKFDIPFAGPFKRITNKGLRIQMFISAVNPVDSAVNTMIPLYGVYEFRCSSLNMTPENAQKFVNDLSLAPSWLVLYPPFFHGTVSEMKRQITFV